jgi:PAS domain S-box-containing protein/putative nucleotidyltransferase with HDIG domain
MPVGNPLRVLILDDSADDALLLVRELQRQGYTPTFHRVETAETMNDVLARQTWDVILADYTLPSFSALTALELLHDIGLDLPFIIVSGSINESMAVDALRAGAHDFVVKGNFARLGPAIAREIREANARQRRKRAETDLLEAETRYRSLVEKVPAIVYVFTFGEINRTTYINSQVETLLGFSPAEWLADPDRWRRQLHPDDRERVLAEVWRADAAHEPLDLEYRMLTRGGSVRWFRNQTTLVLNEAGRPQYSHGLLFDVTERKQAEADSQRQLAQLAALHEIDLAMTTNADLKLTLDVCVNQVIRQLNVDAADILQLDASRQTLEYAVGRGFRSNASGQVSLHLGEGRPGRAALERRIIVEPNLEAAPPPSRRSERLRAEDFVSYYGVPLIVKDQVLGVLEIFHRQLLQPDATWLTFLIALGRQVAIAIENATLFDGLQRSHQELTNAYDATIEGWSRALDLRDKETEGHSQRVAELTVNLAEKMGLPASDLVYVRWGSLLHDIGKMGVPDRILLKPGPLTQEEWVIMTKHPAYAYELLAPIDYLQQALAIPYCHHEKWDSTGYPRGLRGDAIPLAARIFAVVDVWDALCSDRPYRPAWPADKVRAYLQASAGTHFEPRIVEAFLQLGRMP